jgi:hypothetical protein
MPEVQPVPAKSPVARRLVAAIGGRTKNSGPDDSSLAVLRAELAAETLADHIRRATSGPAPLTDAHRERLALLLHPDR